VVTIIIKVTELQEKIEDLSALLKESRDENMALKEQVVQLGSSSPLGDSSQVEVRSVRTLHDN
jgi:cell division protein FtsL